MRKKIIAAILSLSALGGGIAATIAAAPASPGPAHVAAIYCPEGNHG